MSMQTAIRPAHASPVANAIPRQRSFYDRARNAGEDILALLKSRYPDQNGGLRGPDALSAAAALAGEFALRSAGLPLPDKGAWLPGGVQDHVLFVDGDNHTAWSMIVQAATAAGLAADQLPDIKRLVESVTGSLGKAPFPPLSAPPEYRPSEKPLHAGLYLRESVRDIADLHGLSLPDLVIVLGWTAGMVIVESRHTLPLAVAVRLAAEVMIGTSRLAPLRGDTVQS